MFSVTVAKWSVDGYSSPHYNGEGISMSLKQIFFFPGTHLYRTCIPQSASMVTEKYLRIFFLDIQYMVKLSKTSQYYKQYCALDCTVPVTTSAVIL